MFEENAAYEGRIIKGIAGFYYIYVEGHGLAECHAKGVFRKDGIKPLVGDAVSLTITDAAKAQGIINEIKKRASSLMRPEVANVDQVLAVDGLQLLPACRIDILRKCSVGIADPQWIAETVVADVSDTPALVADKCSPFIIDELQFLLISRIVHAAVLGDRLRILKHCRDTVAVITDMEVVYLAVDSAMVI